MSSFPFPFIIVASDGKTMRTLHRPALEKHAAAIEAILADLLLEKPPAAPAPSAPATMTQAELARSQGYTGDTCSQCGQFRMKQSGHCLVCDACGTTTGCS